MVIIIFDSECLSCNKFVHYLLKSDKAQTILFYSFNGKYATDLFHKYKIAPNINTIYYIKNETIQIKSKAIISILIDIKKLKLLKLIGGKAIVKLLDFFYDRFALNRYLFGKTKAICTLDSKHKNVFN